MFTKDNIAWARPAGLGAVLLVLLMALPVQGAPQWGAAPAPVPRSAPAADRPVYDLQCPRAYLGIKGDMLPTYWETGDQGAPVHLLKSQVVDQYLYCVYQTSQAGAANSSIRRLAPAGYTCVSDGVGQFKCRNE